jgi:hypothetical protein
MIGRDFAIVSGGAKGIDSGVAGATEAGVSTVGVETGTVVGGEGELGTPKTNGLVPNASLSPSPSLKLKLVKRFRVTGGLPSDFSLAVFFSTVFSGVISS